MRKSHNVKKIFGGVFVVLGIVILAGCANPLQKEQGNPAQNTSMNSEEKQKSAMHMQGGKRGDMHDMSGLESIAKSDLSDAEKAGIIKMREEEKLARDVYSTLGAKWGQKIFLNITSSEQRHMDEVKQLIDRYDLEDPVTDGAIGVFASADMKKLYDALVAKGNTSLVEALKVGATVEDMDIKDLQTLIVATDNADIKYVYENLKNGSQKHLQSFVKNLNKNGVTYVPQFVSQADYDAIITMTRDAGNGMGHGDGCMGDGSCGMMDGDGKCSMMDDGNGSGCGMQHGGSNGQQGNMQNHQGMQRM